MLPSFIFMLFTLSQSSNCTNLLKELLRWFSEVHLMQCADSIRTNFEASPSPPDPRMRAAQFVTCGLSTHTSTCASSLKFFLDNAFKQIQATTHDLLTRSTAAPLLKLRLGWFAQGEIVRSSSEDNNFSLFAALKFNEI